MNDNLTIRRFVIRGLLGEKDVDIEFNSDITILIADNGLGKTTVLGIIYAVLAGHLHRLRRVEFSSIKVEFGNGYSVEFPAASIQPALNLSAADPAMKRLLRHVPSQLVHQLFDETRGFDPAMFRRHPLARELANIADIPVPYLFTLLHERSQVERELFDGTVSPEEIRKRMKGAFPFDVLYFPTYRRIEEDIEHLGYQRKEGSRTEALIQFGMTDVDARVKEITDQIKNSSVAWYAKINGQMLGQLVDGIKVDVETRQSIQNQNALKIVLDRIGASLTADHKNHILELVASGDIYHSRYDSLVYFLSNLITIYDQQRDLDNAIKDFTRVCNKYLVDKEVVYDESTVEIGIRQTWNSKAIKFSQLSSGEKQIVSLFSRLYLEPGKPLALLFDEPELSLSIEWQRMLLPDIVESGRCRFLLATTHSPFIFENVFDGNASDLGRFIKRAQA